jgi:hypothetical protein
LEECGWISEADELNSAVRAQQHSAAEPVLISTSGIILAGFGEWQRALLEGKEELQCVEYSVNDDEALQYILKLHQPLWGWNSFLRIRLALTLEPQLRQKAVDNMRAGGKFKGSAKLPDFRQIDVRREIANAAGVGVRNVSNVKTILQRAHPHVIQALTEGSLTINGAMRFIQLPLPDQLEQLIRYKEDRAVDSVIRQAILRPAAMQTGLDVGTILLALHQKETQQPGSVGVRVSRLQQTVILVGRDLLPGAPPQRELKST